MVSDLKQAVQFVSVTMPEAHRGILPHQGQRLAFGNRGRDEVPAFRAWLRPNGYAVRGFKTWEDSWVMVIDPPLKMRDTRRVTQALWDASPDHAVRKTRQQPIADLTLQLCRARQGDVWGRSWFTAEEVEQMVIVALVPPRTLPQFEKASGPGTVNPSDN